MSKLKPRAERWTVLLKLVEREQRLDVLNRYAVDEYVEATGADFDVMPYGANKCPLMGRDLSAMARSPARLLERHRTGIEGMAGMGFPRWVWSYRLTIKGKSTLARAVAEEAKP